MIISRLCLCLLVLNSFAYAVPATMNYQGKLTNPSGVALTGTVKIQDLQHTSFRNPIMERIP